jgi:hypothetical protein
VEVRTHTPVYSTLCCSPSCLVAGARWGLRSCLQTSIASLTGMISAGGSPPVCHSAGTNGGTSHAYGCRAGCLHPGTRGRFWGGPRLPPNQHVGTAETEDCPTQRQFLVLLAPCPSCSWWAVPVGDEHAGNRAPLFCDEQVSLDTLFQHQLTRISPLPVRNSCCFTLALPPAVTPAARHPECTALPSVVPAAAGPPASAAAPDSNRYCREVMWF